MLSKRLDQYGPLLQALPHSSYFSYKTRLFAGSLPLLLSLSTCLIPPPTLTHIQPPDRMRPDTMSRYGPKRVASLSASSFPSSSPPRPLKSLDTSPLMDGARPTRKSLTPQRKHHKLLKDGTEVWSEDVEKIFVQGLREYWESPWATYSRGRSRWRNQFLVDYLKKHNIERSKKQVASHIQVLRNMWREQPEFHLVAGGEELFMENGLLASPTSTRRVSGSPQSNHTTPHRDASSLSPTPTSSSSELPSNIPTSMSMPHLTTLTGWTAPSIPPFEHYSDAVVPSALDNFSAGSGVLSDQLRSPVKLEPLVMHPGLFTLPTVPGGSRLVANNFSPSSRHPALSTTRLLSLNLWAEGMQPFVVDIDRMAAALADTIPTPADSPSVLLCIKATISSTDDIMSYPNLHGFQATVTLSERWTSEAKCITKTHSGASVMSQEVVLLDSASITPMMSDNDFTSGAISVALPESALSRCKWLESSVDQITQQVVVDGVVIAAFIYYIQRPRENGMAPSAELVGFQRYKPSARRTHTRTISQPFIASSQHSRSSPQQPMSAPYFGSRSFSSSNDLSFSPYSGLSMPSSLSPNRFSYNAQSPDMFGM